MMHFLYQRGALPQMCAALLAQELEPAKEGCARCVDACFSTPPLALSDQFAGVIVNACSSVSHLHCVPEVGIAGLRDVDKCPIR